MRTTYILFFLFLSGIGTAQVGINTINPDPSSILDIQSTDTGLLIPRMTETQRVGITTPATGLLVYQIDNSDGFWFFNGTTWQFLSGTGGWELTGNPNTDPTTNFLGTTDSQDFVIKTDDNEVMRIASNGNIGVGTTNPQAPLHLQNTVISPLSIRDGSQNNGFVLTSNEDGDATWEQPTPPPANDQDWLFASGSTIADPIYHEGSVTIGIMAPTTHTLLVDSGDPAETTVRLGSVERIFSRTDELFFSHPFLPLDNASLLLGNLNNRWTEVWSNDGVISTSDVREKENIQDLNIGLKEVLKLEPVSFQWKEERVNDYIIPKAQKRTHLGFIAQDIQKAIPEIIEESYWHEYEENPGVLAKQQGDVIGVNYNEMIPVLVKSIQEQEELIRELKEHNKELVKLFEEAKKKIENK